MSVLIKRTSGSIGGSSSVGYPPGNINIIKKVGAATKAYLRWSEPDNIISGNQTLSTWGSTILVRKEGSTPKSPTDGTVVVTNTTKNKYKDTDLVDSGLTNGKTYYYRFYTVSTDKIYNTDSSMIYSITILQADPILKNNSWETIAKVSEAGVASSIWKVGDEIDITLKEYESSTYSFADVSAQTITLQIWDFDHFDKSDGSGKAGICFGAKNLMENVYKMQYYKYSDRGHWISSEVRLMLIDAMPNSMPSNLYSVIKSVNLYGIGYNSDEIRKTEDKVFIPSATEVGFNDIGNHDKYSAKLPIFTDNTSRKKTDGDDNNYHIWWNRTYDTYSLVYDTSYYFYSCYMDGSCVTTDNDQSMSVCFCFNV